MYKIGFIDDDNSMIELYKRRLSRNEIELCYVERCVSLKDVIDWILENNIKCMLVDYILSDAYDYNGTQLVAYINSVLPDLPCIILSNYCETGKKENLVIENLFVDRDDLSAETNSEKFINLVNILKQAVDVFDNRLSRHIVEFEDLKTKKDEGNITTVEEERLIELFKILRAYNEIDDLPAELFTTNASKKMSSILQSLDKLIEKTK